MIEFTLQNVTMIMVIGLVAGVSLGCLGALLRSYPPVPGLDESPGCTCGTFGCHRRAGLPLDPATIDPRYRAVRKGDDLDH